MPKGRITKEKKDKKVSNENKTRKERKRQKNGNEDDNRSLIDRVKYVI